MDSISEMLATPTKSSVEPMEICSSYGRQDSMETPTNSHLVPHPLLTRIFKVSYMVRGVV